MNKDAKYWKQRKDIVEALIRGWGTSAHSYNLNGDGSISEKYLRPTKGWKTSRLLGPDEDGHSFLNRPKLAGRL